MFQYVDTAFFRRAGAKPPAVLQRLADIAWLPAKGDNQKSVRPLTGGMHVSRAIILGIEHPRAVAAIQSLGRAGVPIVAVDHNRNALGFFSRYVTETFRITEDHDSALGLIQGLGKEGGGLLIPTNDHYLIHDLPNQDARIPRRGTPDPGSLP